MSDCTPAERLLEVLTPICPLPVLQGTEQALAIAGESLVPIFRVAYQARDHRIDCVWKWLEPFVAVCDANPALEPFRRPTFLALLNCHNLNVDLPIVVTADQLPQVTEGVTV